MSPTPRLIRALAAAFAIALLLLAGRLAIPGEASFGVAEQVWWLVLGAFAGLLALDAWRRGDAQGIVVERIIPGSVALAVDTPVRLRLRQSSPRALQLALTDHAPPALETHGLPAEIELPAQGHAEVHYRVLAVERGDARFEPAAVQVRSRFGFWTFHLRRGAAETIRVHPNFSAIARLDGLDLEQQARQIGVHMRRQRGEGTEFEQLRDFREGDTLRQIDWKATARHRRPIARQYSEERDQSIVFALDCGRRMRAKDAAISHFDHALNAFLVCAYVALAQGDAVGALGFASEIRWLPPTKGRRGMTTLLRQLYDLKSSTEASDFLSLAEAILHRQPKRSLVVLISNLRDEDADDLLRAVGLLSRRHRVVVANLREELLDEVPARPIGTLEEALLYAGTAHHLAGRERLLRRLRGAGVRIVDSPPRWLHAALVREYLVMKRSGLL
ncbi:MAG: DUF58 domain-containing protein [Myxococcota bacterium]